MGWLTWQTVAAVFVLGLSLIVIGSVGLVIVDSHVTDFDEHQPATLDDLLAHDELCARAERAGEFADMYVRIRQSIDARAGVGRHRLSTGEYAAVPLPSVGVAA